MSRRSQTVTKNGWRGSGDSCSATVSVRDKRWSAPGQFQLWRWMQTTVLMAASRSSQRLLDAIKELCQGKQGVLHAACLLEEGLRSLDIVDLVNVFEVRLLVMKTVPFFLRGTFKTALKASLHEFRRGQHEHDDTPEIWGWKLFFLLPTILLRSCKNESTKEQQQVADGDGCRRTRSNGGPHVFSNFVQLGELSSRQRWREQQSPRGIPEPRSC